MLPAWISHPSGKALATFLNGQSNRWGWHTRGLSSSHCSASTRTDPSWELRVQITPAFREQGLFSTFLYSLCENARRTQHHHLAAFLMMWNDPFCCLFVTLIDCLAFLLNYHPFNGNLNVLVEFQIALSPFLSCHFHLVYSFISLEFTSEDLIGTARTPSH